VLWSIEWIYPMQPHIVYALSKVQKHPVALWHMFGYTKSSMPEGEHTRTAKRSQDCAILVVSVSIFVVRSPMNGIWVIVDACIGKLKAEVCTHSVHYLVVNWRTGSIAPIVRIMESWNPVYILAECVEDTLVTFRANYVWHYD
jgi:hypothetical protein